jgi:hypothetical protein
VWYYGDYVVILFNPEFVKDCKWLSELFLTDEKVVSSHDLALILSLEDSLIDRGIKETLESVHAGHMVSSLMFRIVALQKHDSQSTKCMLEVLSSNTKIFIV